MTDQDIIGHIDELIAEEHALREKATGGGLSADERELMNQLSARLDQCWDLLRQRRARREFGENPDEAKARPVNEVEGYRQ